MGEVPAREVLWNIPNHYPMYFFFIAALSVSVYFFIRRWRLWRIGQPEDRSDQRKHRLLYALKDALLQVKVVERRGPGIMHVMMYASMMVLLVATASAAAQADLGLDIIHGDYYLYFMSLAVDLAGAAFCLAMVGCLIRRAVSKRLDTKPSDILVLALLLAIGVTGFILEGLRIAATGDAWAAWSPVGNLVSLLFVGAPADALMLAHKLLWWFHMGIAFALIAYWTYSKLVHVLLVPAAAYWRSLKPKGELPYIDVEDESLTTLGVGSLEDFTWKDLFDTQACIRCNRCQDVCPAYAAGKPLSPKGLMQNLLDGLEERGPVVCRLQQEALKGLSEGAELPSSEELIAAADLSDTDAAALSRKLVGDVVSPDALWSCTTCGACMEVCPAFLEHAPKIVKMRTYQVSMESAFPSEAQATFRNLENNGNPWGLGWQTRSKWAVSLDVPTLDEKPDAEYLYWPGCSGAFDSRSRKVSMALVSLLNEAGVSFAILGNEEKCCGDAARRLGNEFLYSMLASENIATLNERGVKKIIVQCPHCYQALSRDYPQLGGHYEVVHHAELLAELLAEGRIKRDLAHAESVTFHDPCYLGRYRGVYDAPREVLRAAGSELVEMPRHGAASFCCGAGGGRMWLEDTMGERLGDLRAREACETGAEGIATACPFCLTMLTDGAASCGTEVPVRDVAEILAERG